MSNNLNGLIPEDLPEDTGGDYTPLPAGEYSAIIIECELKETKAQDGHYLSFKYQIADGEYEGRYVFDIMNIKNKSDKATQIGLTQLNNLNKAIGKQIKDTSDCLNEVVFLKLGIQPAKNDFPARNSVKSIKSYNSEVASEKKTDEKPWEA